MGLNPANISITVYKISFLQKLLYEKAIAWNFAASRDSVTRTNVE